MKNLFYDATTHLLNGHMLYVHIGIASMRQFQCIPATYITEIKSILKYTLNKYHVHLLSSFKHLKLPISIIIPVTIWQIVYIYMTALLPILISWTGKLVKVSYLIQLMQFIWLHCKCIPGRSFDSLRRIIGRRPCSVLVSLSASFAYYMYVLVWCGELYLWERFLWKF